VVSGEGFVSMFGRGGRGEERVCVFELCMFVFEVESGGWRRNG